MIRSYTVAELEKISGTTRRTISDYIAKGVLAGPSHRGRGARYPQKDLDTLTVLPRIRTLMKKEYPTLKKVIAFLEQLSVRDIHRLAGLTSEDAFINEMRRLRVRNSLMGLLPYMAPEKIDQVLADLTPGQIRGIDSGRYQIGAVIDIEALLHTESDDAKAVKTQAMKAMNNSQWKGAPAAPNGVAGNGELDPPRVAGKPSWAVSWLSTEAAGGAPAVDAPARAGATADDEHTRTTPDLAALVAKAEDTQPDLPVINGSDPGHEHAKASPKTVEDRLIEIASRLEKLEAMLEKS